MKFGLFGGATRRDETADSGAYRQFIDYVIEADRLGFESIFLVEHHFSGLGQLSASLNLLSYLAARTDRIRLGTGVAVLPWHNPVLLAEQAATVDLLSGGRLDFGVGKGYREIEFNGFRIPREEAQERYDEALEIILKAWTTPERFSWRGKRWAYDDIVVEPAVVQQPHPPIWTGAGTLVSVARVGKSGFNVLLDQYGSTEVTQNRIAAFQEGRAAGGIAYDPMHLGLARHVQVTASAQATQDAVEARRARQANMNRFGPLPGLPAEPSSYADADATPDDSAIIGEPHEVIARLATFHDIGVDYVLLLASNADVENLRRFAAEVMPALAGDRLTDQDLEPVAGGVIDGPIDTSHPD